MPDWKPYLLAAAAMLWMGNMALAQDLAGPFTQAQVMAGGDDYYGYCGECHGDALEGAGEVPPLTGGIFTDDWSKKSVGEFYRFISTAMPAGLAGDLSPESYSNIVAYILAANGARAGATPFNGQSDVVIGTIANGKLVPGVLNGSKP